MRQKTDSREILFACVWVYIGQTIVYNFLPLLYMIFYNEFQIPLSQIAMLTTINFTSQIVVGIFAGKVADIVGYKFCAISMEMLFALGMILLVVLTQTMTNYFLALVISFSIIGIGAGIAEAMNPVFIQSCPVKNKAAVNSFISSFASWSYVGVVLLSTLFLAVFGNERWRMLTLLWLIVPLITLFLICRVHFNNVGEQHDEKKAGLNVKQMLSMKLYWLLLIVMFCANACDAGYSQWISAFMESSLEIPKFVGDLAGPSSFAVGCGIGRVIYTYSAKHIRLKTCMMVCFAGSIVGFVLTAIAPSVFISIAICMFSGLCIGNLYPGAVSLVSEEMIAVSTQSFTLLVVSGGIGGAVSGAMIGNIVSVFGNNMRAGVASGMIWPMLGLAIVMVLKNNDRFEAKIGRKNDRTKA